MIQKVYPPSPPGFCAVWDGVSPHLALSTIRYATVWTIGTLLFSIENSDELLLSIENTSDLLSIENRGVLRYMMLEVG